MNYLKSVSQLGHSCKNVFHYFCLTYHIGNKHWQTANTFFYFPLFYTCAFCCIWLWLSWDSFALRVEVSNVVLKKLVLCGAHGDKLGEDNEDAGELVSDDVDDSLSAWVVALCNASSLYSSSIFLIWANFRRRLTSLRQLFASLRSKLFIGNRMCSS